MKNKSLFLKTAILAAKKAGKVTLKYFEKELEIDYKAKNEIVTNVDKESEAVIIKTIKSKFPDHSIWSEELGEEKTGSEYRWVIDPLDGTFIYAHQVPLFGISIALEKNNKPIVAVTYFPAIKKMYYAQEGKGCYFNDKKVNVSENFDFFLVTTDALRYPDYILKPFHKELVSRKISIKSFGSAAYDMSLVASGNADVCFVYNIKPGDIAAGILLIREAGGVVTNLSGEQATSKDKNIIGSNKKWHSKILKKINH